MLKHVAAAVAVGLAALASGSALADGMPRGSLKDTPSCCAGPNWNGFYIGATVGYGHLVGRNDYTGPPISQTWNSDSGTGGLAGVTIGFDRQVRERMIWGLFAEYDLSAIEVEYQNPTVSQSFRLRDTISIGSRTGFLVSPSTMLFMTGGYSWAHGKSDGYFDIDNGGILPGVTKLNLSGWFIGGGMEVAMSDRLFLRTEARYTKFGDEITNTDGITYVDRFEPSVLAARVSLTYKFQREHQHHAEPLK